MERTRVKNEEWNTTTYRASLQGKGGKGRREGE
jgi:hypothetical protein